VVAPRPAARCAGEEPGASLSAVRRHVVVHGAVQGVGFRASCARRAAQAGLTGWVRNTAEGTVEAVFEGPAASVDALVAWCRQGPPMARVRAVETLSEVPSTGAGPDRFSVR